MHQHGVPAVVMDMFTHVDIFKDLLDAGFKRKAALYIIVDESKVKYVLHMCERTRMHLGHLKASSEDLEMYPLWIKEDYYILNGFCKKKINHSQNILTLEFK
ncbi:protein FAM83G [Gorilla gorilla gorilla]|uniref:protein FAM83G n=1 Tax=Gorilla gorilla gorilla TaxID=9595 RepID=UPI0007DC69A6|nr:protein FAM83G [Gorilla gorilla gorilla]|eukprot:XP_016865626.1 protein FAM83G [Homo sapiens]